MTIAKGVMWAHGSGSHQARMMAWILVGVICVLTRGAVPALADSCPNAQRRAEQPFGQNLPDCRAYELVSPPDTNGQDATDLNNGKIQRAVRSSPSSEEAEITYTSNGTFGTFPEQTGANVETQFLSQRKPTGWETRPISPLYEPHQAEAAISYDALAFTPELNAGLASSSASLVLGAPPTEANKEDLYLASLEDTTPSYRYITTVNRPLAASENLSHVAFTNEEAGEKVVAYEWANGTVLPVGVSNTGEVLEANVGDARRIPSILKDQDTWHAVSADGLRVYFTSPGVEENFFIGSLGPHQLFVRVNPEQTQSPLDIGGKCETPADACTIEVSASQRAVPDPHGPQSARFWGASADGSRVFFTSKAELTEGSSGEAYTGPDDNAANLYEYDFNRPDGERLNDLTVDSSNLAEGAAVQGVAQISENGSYVYFVANGALAEGATQQQCRGETEKEKNGEEPKQENLGCNLYVCHEGGAPVFVATLAVSDVSDWDPKAQTTGGDYGGPAVNTSVVSPSGQYFGFVSESEITHYNNTETAEGECEGEIPETGATGSGKCREVFLYDAASGGLVCASCNPRGPPVGYASLAGYPQEPAGFDEYRARNLLNDGTLFFMSSDNLVTNGSDGRENVYEFENGGVHPISDVEGAQSSYFMDASANGQDVYFATTNDLVPQDVGDNLAVYDARLDGGFPASPLPPTCVSGEACKPSAAPAPGVFGAPATETFSGPGNVSTVLDVKRSAAEVRSEELAKALKTCNKQRAKRKRAACAKRARARYGPRKVEKRRAAGVRKGSGR